MTESLPGITSTIRWAAAIATALFVGAFGVGYCAGGRGQSGIEAVMKQQRDSIAALERDRALAIGQAAALRVVAATAHTDRLAAVAHADSLEADADRHRVRRIRIIDSTHIGTTTSDTQHVETVTTVPVDVTVQLQLDSAAFVAQDLALDKFARENNALTLENLKLWQAVASDSLEFREKDAEIATLEKLRAPRCGAKCGAAITVGTLALIDLARRALLAVLHP